jgi:dnd system-associated protein 4
MKNLKVYIDKDKHSLYEKLVKRGADNPDYFPFQTMKDLFMLAACLGVKYGAYEPLASSKDIFSSDVFDEKADYPVMAVIAYKKERNIAILTDERKILEVVQGYANGGISYVVEEIVNNPGTPLNNLIALVIPE